MVNAYFKKVQFSALLSALFWATPIIAQNRIITGTVKDSAVKEPLAFCNILLLNTTIGTTTDFHGKFRIRIPPGIVQPKLVLSYIGYKNDTIQLENGKNDGYVISMKNKNSMLNSIIVTGVTRATLVKENPLTMVSVSPHQIEQTTEDNVIDAISDNAPGFEAVKTGPNISKPFINGEGYNRVLTLYNGMRVETQQWGDEHGVPIDDYIIERAEIIEGPASLMYGSDAIAGVLSLFPIMPHDDDSLIHGRILSEYQTNNGLIGNSFLLTYAGYHWSYALRGSERIAKNYSDPIDGRVYNTGFKMVNSSAFVGYKWDKGYSHLNYTLYDNRQGIPDGSRDSLTRQFTYQIYETQGENTIQPLVDNIKERPIVPENVLNSYYISPLSQRIQDYRLYSDNLFRFAQSDLKVFIGGEQNVRREYDHPTDTTQAGEYIILNTLDYGLRYDAPSVLNIETSIGVNGMYQTNTNSNATDFPIPDYTLFDAGTYGYAKWEHEKWTIAGGLRYDERIESGQEMYIKANPATGFYQQVPLSDSANSIRQFSAFTLHFYGITGSIGTTYQVNNHIALKSNFARGYRAPNITEIASNGLDPGAHIVYKGNSSLLPEFNFQEDIGITAEYRQLFFSVSIFNNNIQNYIYEAQKVDENGNPVIIVPGNKTLQYQQSNAQLYGANSILNITPEILKGFSFNNSFSIVYGFNRNPEYSNAGAEGKYLPFIPPPRLLSSISQNISTKWKTLSLLTVKIEADCNAAQNHYLGLYNTETPTAAYTLFNCSFHANINYTGKHIMQFEIGVNNILNTAYQSHLSRLQYFEYYSQSPNGHLGIYNMGRNVCFRFIFPF